MSETIRITVLVENSVQRAGLVAEHGLAFHIQAGPNALLFDTGQTDLAIFNAEMLRLPLDQVTAIALSHGHYDHTGGLPALLEIVPRARVFIHPAALEQKFSRGANGQTRPIGMSASASQALSRRAGGWIETRTHTELVPGIRVTGEIPRRHAGEDTGGAFFLDPAATRPDPLVDDQALIIDLGESVVVLLGCAHSGLVNTLDYVRQLTGGKPVRAVIGGLHLGSATADRMEHSLARLQAEPKLQCLAPAHCTGWPATARLWSAFPNLCQPAGVGSVFEFARDRL